jgi:hypothetical protein
MLNHQDLWLMPSQNLIHDDAIDAVHVDDANQRIFRDVRRGVQEKLTTLLGFWLF